MNIHIHLLTYVGCNKTIKRIGYLSLYLSLFLSLSPRILSLSPTHPNSPPPAAPSPSPEAQGHASHATRCRQMSKSPRPQYHHCLPKTKATNKKAIPLICHMEPQSVRISRKHSLSYLKRNGKIIQVFRIFGDGPDLKDIASIEYQLYVARLINVVISSSST